MGTTTMGVKLDDATRERIKSAASRIDRTPHWLIKQAIFNYLEKLENDETLPELPALLSGAANESDEAGSRRKSRISRSSNSPSRSCRSRLAARRSPPPGVARKPTRCRCCWSRPDCRSRWESRRISWRISWRKTAQPEDRQRPRRHGAESAAGVLPLLTGRGGADVLAEALLRIPDKATRDALIRDKISNGNWQSHIGRSPSLFVNAATRGCCSPANWSPPTTKPASHAR